MNKVWSENEKEFIRQNYEKMTDEQLLTALGGFTNRKISLSSLRAMRTRLGKKKRGGRPKKNG